MNQMLTQTANRLFDEQATHAVLEEAERGKWPADLWQAVVEMGLQGIAIPEEVGGVGGTLAEAITVLHVAAQHAVPLPLAEVYLAGWLLGEAGIALPDAGPITVAWGDSHALPQLKAAGPNQWRLTGSFDHVPFARHCPYAIIFCHQETKVVPALLNLREVEIAPRDNVAGEPLDELHFDGVPIEHLLETAISTEAFQLRGALFRSVQMTGALEKILEISIRYAGEREQFGRPIAKFQAIQQSMAQLAAEVAASQAAIHGAVLAYQPRSGQTRAEESATAQQQVRAKAAVAMAKIRAGEAAGTAARIAHQVHGAMGYTQEYPLHFYTRRLWAWRDDFGNETHWADWLGGYIAEQGPDKLWPFVASI